MIQGLRTAIYTVTDLEAAKEWYSKVLGAAPYFDEPFYAGFNVEGFELGLMPVDHAPDAGGVLTYWGVEDAHAAFKRLLRLGATKHQPVMDVGGGIQVASVFDPFGNIFGVIYNPNFQAA
ncbi:MAG TPA: VOC family protein [Abditibacteriaceae bacterium]|jgi:predicted enzyme related to lactoylglutathione lyase